MKIQKHYWLILLKKTRKPAETTAYRTKARAQQIADRHFPRRGKLCPVEVVKVVECSGRLHKRKDELGRRSHWWISINLPDRTPTALRSVYTAEAHGKAIRRYKHFDLIKVIEPGPSANRCPRLEGPEPLLS